MQKRIQRPSHCSDVSPQRYKNHEITRTLLWLALKANQAMHVIPEGELLIQKQNRGNGGGGCYEVLPNVSLKTFK